MGEAKKMGRLKKFEARLREKRSEDRDTKDRAEVDRRQLDDHYLKAGGRGNTPYADIDRRRKEEDTDASSKKLLTHRGLFPDVSFHDSPRTSESESRLQYDEEMESAATDEVIARAKRNKKIARKTRDTGRAKREKRAKLRAKTGISDRPNITLEKGKGPDKQMMREALSSNPPKKLRKKK